MFDPFQDFETLGYLRNKYGEKDRRTIREMEHELFRANLADAMDYLAAQTQISYENFLTVHKILFSSFYPWAGQDRTLTAPNAAIKEGATLFCHPRDCRRAVEQGLRLAQDPAIMLAKPGEVMGFFAYAHPFLDGNGRAMLVVHSELCHRAGFSLSWERSTKDGYLAALSEEIERPGRGLLDSYLEQFIDAPLDRRTWGQSIHTLNGLDGQSKDDQVEGDLNDPAIAEQYKEFEAQRGYKLDADPV